MLDVDLLDRVADYIGFDAAARDDLRKLGPLLAPAFDPIVERFYAAIDRDPKAAAVLEGPEQVLRLKGKLKDWLQGVFGGVYDGEYLERRARIGRVHVQVGLSQRYMFAAMSVVRRSLHEALHDLELEADLARRAHAAVDSICDIELAIMLETYREAYILRRTAESETMAAMGKLTAGLAHEIRNPLNAAKLQLELLGRKAKKRDDNLADTVGEKVSLVRDELGRLSGLLDDFLSLARPREIRPSSVDVCGLAQDVVQLQAPVAQAEGASVRMGSCDSVKAHVDPDRIRQVLLNLVRNAIEATAGAHGGEVVIDVTRAEACAEVSVSDNGPGLDPAVAEKVFESFVTTKEAGTGLGLTICKNIVERHGGSIRLRSDGQGTTVSLTLPL